jgi:ribosome-interacting GTPase 1
VLQFPAGAVLTRHTAQVLDATKSEHHKDILTRELEAVGLRLNCGPPQIYYKKNKTGGISFSSTVPLTHLDQNLVSHILHGALCTLFVALACALTVLRSAAEYRIHNAEVLFREDATVDQFIDVIEGKQAMPCLTIGLSRSGALMHRAPCRPGNRKYIQCLYVYNKIDVLSIEEARTSPLSQHGCVRRLV